MAEILRASVELGMRFPEDYTEFVERYGGAEVGPCPIFGLRKAPCMANLYSVIDVNLEFRKSSPPGTDDWLIVSSDHSGNWIGITPGGKVSMWDHDFGELVQLADNFEGYLRKVCLELQD
jgi:SMI1-KNR4 cell-wall